MPLLVLRVIVFYRLNPKNFEKKIVKKSNFVSHPHINTSSLELISHSFLLSSYTQYIFF
jgi:hypothetical protein